jgi:hypothetical protein
VNTPIEYQLKSHFGVSRFCFQSYSIFKNPSPFHNSSLKTVMSSSATAEDGSSPKVKRPKKVGKNVEGSGSGEGKGEGEGKGKGKGESKDDGEDNKRESEGESEGDGKDKSKRKGPQSHYVGNMYPDDGSFLDRMAAIQVCMLFHQIRIFVHVVR